MRPLKWQSSDPYASSDLPNALPNPFPLSVEFSDGPSEPEGLKQPETLLGAVVALLLENARAPDARYVRAAAEPTREEYAPVSAAAEPREEEDGPSARDGYEPA